MSPTLLRAPIASVLAFRQGARITRTLSVARGTERARVGPLPLGLADGSLRVRARRAAVREASLAVTTIDAPGLDERPAHNEPLEAARLIEGRLEARIAAIRACLESLDGIELPPRARIRDREPGPSPTSARMAVARLRRTMSDVRHERLRELDEELRRARETRAALEEQERRATSARQTREHELRKVIDLVLDDVGEGAELTIEYDVANARWYPVYTLRFDEAYASARLEVRALIAQHTGEDWTKVALTCSTAMPHRHAELPELKSIRLGRAQPAPRRGFREPPQGAEALFADFDAGYPHEPASTRAGGVKAGLRMPVAKAAPTIPAPTSGAVPVGAAVPEAAAFGGAPPPPPRAPSQVMDVRERHAAPGGPPPAAAPAPQSAPRRRGGRAKKKAIAADTGRFAASALLSLEDEMAVEAGGPPPEPPPPPTWEVGESLLDFGALRMAGPADPRRGRLRPATPAERHGSPAAAAAVRAGVRARLPSPPARAVAPAPIAGFDHAYVATAAVHVPSDAAFHSVALRVLEGEASRRYVVAPRESRDVFRYVALGEPLGEPLLPGPLDVYVGDRFLTSRGMPTTPAGELLELGLGVEEGIEVVRNASFEERTTGLMRGGLDLVHEVDIELESHLGREAPIEVRERLPVPREGDDDVEVRVDSVTPRWEAWEPEPEPGQPALRGGHRWRFRLERAGQAGARRRLELRYVIRIASKHALVGGNRRES